MKKIILYLVVICLFSCTGKVKENNTNKEDAIIKIVKKELPNKSFDITINPHVYEKDKETTIYRYKNVNEIVNEKNGIQWAYKNYHKHRISALLYFNLETCDNLSIEIGPVIFWLTLPIKIKDDKITVFWDDNVDYKYKTEMVKTFISVSKSHKGKPFMSLDLINDTTLSAIYYDSILVKKLNRLSNDIVIFPKTYHANKYY